MAGGDWFDGAAWEAESATSARPKTAAAATSVAATAVMKNPACVHVRTPFLSDGYCGPRQQARR